MVNRLLGLPDGPIWTFFFLCVGGLTFYFVLATTSYLTFFVFARRTFHPTYVPDWAELRQAAKWSVVAGAGNAALIAPIHYLLASGYGRLYFDVSTHGWLWLGTSAILVLCVCETMIYWMHRLLHWGPMHRRLHGKHHEFKMPTPYVGMAFRPLDAFLQGLPHHICAFLLPVHASVYLVSVTFVTVWAVMIHDRISFVRWRAINHTGHHTLHHWYQDCNFGQYFTFWDRWMGTYRDPEVKYADVPSYALIRGLDALAGTR